MSSAEPSIRGARTPPAGSAARRAPASAANILLSSAETGCRIVGHGVSRVKATLAAGVLLR